MQRLTWDATPQDGGQTYVKKPKTINSWLPFAIDVTELSVQWPQSQAGQLESYCATKDHQYRKQLPTDRFRINYPHPVRHNDKRL